jgi:hypothetical protein
LIHKILRHPVTTTGNSVTVRIGPMESKLRGSLRRLGAGARRLTHEAVPRLANYSNMFPMTTTGARPTVEELHESIVEDKVYRITRLGLDYSTVY